MVVRSMDLLLASYIPDLELKKPVTQKNQEAQNRRQQTQKKRKISSKNLVELKDQERGSLARWKMFRQLLLHSSQTPQKKTITVPPPMPAKVEWEA